MAKNRAVTSGGAGRPRLVLVTPLVADAAAFAPQLSTACSAGDIAAVILRLAPGDDETQIKRVRDVATALTSSGPILMLDGHANLVTRTPADGVHLNGSTMVSAARDAFRDQRTIGAGGLHSRHDAMTAAESGADYVLFGEPDATGRRPGLPALVERVEWWAELFVIPCVAYVVSLHEMDDLVAAGADFIALGEEAVWNSPQGAARALAAAMVHLAVAEPAE
jgi:thiamine-phosphate pyrophosphorylase